MQGAVIAIVLLSVFVNRRRPIGVRKETISKRKNVPQSQRKPGAPVRVGSRRSISDHDDAVVGGIIDPMIGIIKLRQRPCRLCLLTPFGRYAGAAAQRE